MGTPNSGQFTAKLKKNDRPNQSHGFTKLEVMNKPHSRQRTRLRQPMDDRGRSHTIVTTYSLYPQPAWELRHSWSIRFPIAKVLVTQFLKWIAACNRVNSCTIHKANSHSIIVIAGSSLTTQIGPRPPRTREEKSAHKSTSSPHSYQTPRGKGSMI